MSRTSVLVGTVIDGNPVENRVINNEKFYTIKAKFHKAEIRVLYSQYTFDNTLNKDTKIAVTGCLMSDIKQGSRPDFYLYANKIEVVDMDTESTNTLNFRCSITRVKDFCINSRCMEIQPLVAAERNPLGATSILYISARDGIARKLKDREKGYALAGKGYLRSYRDIYDITLIEAYIVDEHDNVIEDLNN